MNTREIMGEQATLDAILGGTITEFIDDGITILKAYSLSYIDSLVKIELPNCKTIQASGIREDPNLTELVLPYGVRFNDSTHLDYCPKLGLSVKTPL